MSLYGREHDCTMLWKQQGLQGIVVRDTCKTLVIVHTVKH